MCLLNATTLFFFLKNVFFLFFSPEVSMNTISEIVGRRVQLKGLIGKRAVKCPYCNFYFMKNGSDLQRHIWAHEGSSAGTPPVAPYHSSSPARSNSLDSLLTNAQPHLFVRKLAACGIDGTLYLRHSGISRIFF